MLRTKNGLPKHCGWNFDREDGKRRGADEAHLEIPVHPKLRDGLN
jgi:hypothetical protein